MGFEENIKKSFVDVRMDVIAVKNELLKLAQSQRELTETVKRLKKQPVSKAVKKKTSKKSKK